MPLEWPWNRRKTPSEPPATATSHDVKPPAAEPGSIEARLSQIETALTGLQLQWQETLDKLGRWSSRQAARERARVNRDLDELSDGQEAHEDAPGSTNGGGDGVEVGPGMNATQRAIQKAQLRARIPPRGGSR